LRKNKSREIWIGLDFYKKTKNLSVPLVKDIFKKARGLKEDDLCIVQGAAFSYFTGICQCLAKLQPSL
jgi:phage pi2 protein 07